MLSESIAVAADENDDVLAASIDTTPPLVDVGAVAAALGLSSWTIYRWAEAGRIPCVHAGRKVRFVLGEVVAALRCGPPQVRDAAKQPTGKRGACHRAVRPPAGIAPSVGDRPKRGKQDPTEHLRSIVAATRALGASVASARR